MTCGGCGSIRSGLIAGCVGGVRPLITKWSGWTSPESGLLTGSPARHPEDPQDPSDPVSITPRLPSKAPWREVREGFCRAAVVTAVTSARYFFACYRTRRHRVCIPQTGHAVACDGLRFRLSNRLLKSFRSARSGERGAAKARGRHHAEAETVWTGFCPFECRVRVHDAERTAEVGSL